MKILHITPEAPGKLSGGAMCVRQTLLSLVDNGYDVDYVGPVIGDDRIRKTYGDLYELEPGSNVPLRVYDTLFMNTNLRYRSWLKLNLDFTQYHAIVMDFTKLNYVLNKVPNDKLIVRVHNVEADYSHNNFKHKKSLVNFLDDKFAPKRECQIVNKAKKLIALTEKDRNRLCTLYHIAADKIEVIPICLEEPEDILAEERKTNGVSMIINGSLWFGPNYEGIKWFLNHVYSKLKFSKHLIIAGSHPNTELLDQIKKDNTIELVDTPPAMSPYLKQADISIAPIFDGAGMKVKVAEALSYGLPIVGTSHAFEGYQITDGVDSYRSDTAQQFIDNITLYSLLTLEQRGWMKDKCRELFNNNYNQKCSSNLFGEILSGVYNL